jgi:hypothetical protein
MTIGEQLTYLFLLPVPVACIAWTVTHENIFREAHEWCEKKSKTCRRLYQRKFFYLFTCEFCFSHYLTVILLLITRFHLLYEDWRGYMMAGFSIVWIANIYLSLYGRIRLDIKRERIEIEEKETGSA